MLTWWQGLAVMVVNQTWLVMISGIRIFSLFRSNLRPKYRLGVVSPARFLFDFTNYVACQGYSLLGHQQSLNFPWILVLLFWVFVLKMLIMIQNVKFFFLEQQSLKSKCICRNMNSHNESLASLLFSSYWWHCSQNRHGVWNHTVVKQRRCILFLHFSSSPYFMFMPVVQNG